MRGFKFRLEVVLAQRKRIEDECAGDLGRAVQERLARDAAVKAIDDQEAESYARQEEVQRTGTFSALDLEAFVRFRQGLASHRLQAQADLNQAKRVEDRARSALVEARKNREVLDRLKEKQFKQWQAEVEAADARLLDELATQAYARPRED
ncbi:MAG: flagellar export protein FliJ [Cyanobacteria bacterium REEB65]|nr:flagellar export protein FliJ [Cyanobacteria bacterium REEB65]